MIENMTNEHEPDFDLPEDWGPTGELIEVSTPVFTGDAISMHDFPYMMVLDLMTTPEPYKTVKSVGMFNLALGASAVDLELASFNEMHEAMSKWIAGSNRQRRTELERAARELEPEDSDGTLN